MRTPVHRELDAWGPIIDRLTDITIGHQRGHITDREYLALRSLYHWVWKHTPVK